MMILLLFIVGFALYYLAKNPILANSFQTSKNSAKEVLKLRYVNGEIDDEAYEKMLETINK